MLPAEHNGGYPHNWRSPQSAGQICRTAGAAGQLAAGGPWDAAGRQQSHIGHRNPMFVLHQFADRIDRRLGVAAGGARRTFGNDHQPFVVTAGDGECGDVAAAHQR